MTDSSLTKYSVIKKLRDGLIVAREAARQLSLTVRHVRRLKKKVEQKGAKALIHGNIGKERNRRIDETKREEVATIIKGRYHEFVPILAKEKLEEKHGIALSIETIRTLMIKGKLWKPRGRKTTKARRSWRPRMECEG